MKKIFSLIAFIIISTCSCGTSEDGPQEQSSIVVYLVDFTSNEFEAGTTMNINKLDFDFSDLPVTADIEEPNGGLDGAVSINFTPTNVQLFNAELSEEGNSRIFAPSFLSPSEFFRLDDPVAFPSQLQIEDIEGPYNEPFQTVWEAIDDLAITKIFLDEEALFGRFLYKSSENVPEQWKWVIILYNQ